LKVVGDSGKKDYDKNKWERAMKTIQASDRKKKEQREKRKWRQGGGGLEQQKVIFSRNYWTR